MAKQLQLREYLRLREDLTARQAERRALDRALAIADRGDSEGRDAEWIRALRSVLARVTAEAEAIDETLVEVDMAQPVYVGLYAHRGEEAPDGD